MLTNNIKLQSRWVKTAPHLIDSMLLASGLYLMWTLQQYPFTDAWLTAKIAALLGYIIIGSYALHRGKSYNQRRIAFILALGCAAYIITVARTHSPWPF